jgi:hypothetical protein
VAGDGPDDHLAELGAELAAQVVAAVPGWVERETTRVFDAWLAAPGAPATTAEERAAVLDTAAQAGVRAASALAPVLGALLTADVDDQDVTPLQLVRELVRFPTAVLEAAGVPAVVRDRFAEERFPDDPYDLLPASLAALDPGLREPALTWGAAKAFAHRHRHGGSGGGGNG